MTPQRDGGAGPGPGGGGAVRDGADPVGGWGASDAARDRTPWQHYIDLIRALDTERAAEEGRTAGHRHGAESAVLELERLSPLLIEQGADLTHLARRLRLAQPRLSASEHEATGSPYELVVLATRFAARAGSHAREAHQLATRPRLLPRWPAGLRNFVLYLAWALAGLAIQYAIVATNQAPPPATILLVIPTVAFVAGLITVSVLGRARVGPDQVGRSVRMGALICFGIFPVGVLILVLRSYVHH